MNNKREILNALREELNQWEAVLGRLSEEQILEPMEPTNRSIKDVIAHLWAWQQRTAARVEAAQRDQPPVFPSWPEGLEPEQEDVDEINEWIFQTNRDRSWDQVHTDWKTQFQHVLDLGETIPEQDMLTPGKYSWLESYPLSLILQATYEHHHIEHLGPVRDWLRQKGYRS